MGVRAHVQQVAFPDRWEQADRANISRTWPASFPGCIFASLLICVMP